MRVLAIAAAAILASTPAFAHVGHGEGGFAAGFTHPFGGLDHVLAMVAVGLWAALRGERALWLWPAAFVGAMLAGFIAVHNGLVLPALETMIAGSVIVLGAAIVLGLKAPLLVGALAIAAFGLTHGAAHGLEVQGAAIPFAAGFALATALLHAAGLGIGIGADRIATRWPMRLAGAGIAAAGLAIATQIV